MCLIDNNTITLSKNIELQFSAIFVSFSIFFTHTNTILLYSILFLSKLYNFLGVEIHISWIRKLIIFKELKYEYTANALSVSFLTARKQGEVFGALEQVFWQQGEVFGQRELDFWILNKSWDVTSCRLILM
jgi:hypothetical protein